jgi:hypothetical protein
MNRKGKKSLQRKKNLPKRMKPLFTYPLVRLISNPLLRISRKSRSERKKRIRPNERPGSINKNFLRNKLNRKRLMMMPQSTCRAEK